MRAKLTWPVVCLRTAARQGDALVHGPTNPRSHNVRSGRRVLAAVITALAVFAAWSLAPVAADSAVSPEVARATPEAATGRSKIAAGRTVRGASAVVVTANPIATEAALKILDAGGNALDATVTAQLVLNSAEPQSSGIGGGAFLLYWDAAAKKLTTYDGRETAPAAAKPDRFQNPDGTSLDFYEAARSARSVGVPGAAALLDAAHKAHGRLGWEAIVAPAVDVAAKGFTVSRRLNNLLIGAGAGAFDETARALFFSTSGQSVAIGTKLTNPALALSLAAIQREGAAGFYRGPIAASIIETLAAAPLALGDMTPEDIASYQAIPRAPVCSLYRGWKICGMGPPSSGGVAVSQILTLLEPFDLGTAPSADAMHLIAEAGNLAFADRARFLADPDKISVPVAGLLDRSYLATRSALIDPARAAGAREAGEPPKIEGRRFGDDPALGRPGTTHISIVDRDGNAVAMTSSIETAFGSGRMASGFLLNNQLTDFAFAPKDEAGRDIANRVGAGKRPRSSMAPTMIFTPDGDLYAVLGSPGGSQIIGYVVKTVVALLDWNMSADGAVSLGNFSGRNGPLDIELGLAAPRLAFSLALKGHAIRVMPMTSGLNVAIRRDDGWEAASDPRREGVAAGQFDEAKVPTQVPEPAIRQ